MYNWSSTTNPRQQINAVTSYLDLSNVYGSTQGVADALRTFVRNLLFANGGLQDNGQELIARDIERARDDGIGTYNQVREAYGLPAVTSFAQITSNVAVQQELKAAYGGFVQTSKKPAAIMISRGGVNVNGVDFVLAPG
jgi:hypothetical protein